MSRVSTRRVRRTTVAASLNEVQRSRTPLTHYSSYASLQDEPLTPSALVLELVHTALQVLDIANSIQRVSSACLHDGLTCRRPGRQGRSPCGLRSATELAAPSSQGEPAQGPETCATLVCDVLKACMRSSHGVELGHDRCVSQGVAAPSQRQHATTQCRGRAFRRHRRKLSSRLVSGATRLRVTVVPAMASACSAVAAWTPRCSHDTVQPKPATAVAHTQILPWSKLCSDFPFCKRLFASCNNRLRTQSMRRQCGAVRQSRWRRAGGARRVRGRMEASSRGAEEEADTEPFRLGHVGAKCAVAAGRRVPRIHDCHLGLKLVGAGRRA